jgi:uncharacterized protein
VNSSQASSTAQTIAITGASGLIGTALQASLRAGGHTVVRVVRRNPSADDVVWDPTAGTIDAAKLDGVNAVVHLAGEGIADSKWTDEHKKRVMESRTLGTTLLATTLAKLDRPPTVLASGSAVGFYGDRGDQELTESAAIGAGFLAEVVGAWESSTQAAQAAGIRVAHLRTGIVLSTKGGALKQQLLPFKLGLGGRLGKGTQWLPWISITDEVAAIQHVLQTDSLRGPVNLTAPSPVTNAVFTKALGAALKRPTIIPIPLLPLKVMYGAEMVQEMLLSSTRVLPQALLNSGFVFKHSELSPALAAVLTEKV